MANKEAAMPIPRQVEIYIADNGDVIVKLNGRIQTTVEDVDAIRLHGTIGKDGKRQDVSMTFYSGKDLPKWY